jgi:hypothetical protein
MRSKNKKAAFEMSITTIVILVIALSMLIFGLIFVRNMMCSGMNIMTDVTKGTQKEIDSLFSTKGGEVVCLGEGEDVQDIYPTGDLQKIYCGFNVDQSKTFSMSLGTPSFIPPAPVGFDQRQLSTAVSSALISLSPPGQVTAYPGSDALIPVAYVRFPKDSPTFSFQVPLTITGQQTKILVFNVKRIGAVQGAIC